MASDWVHNIYYLLTMRAIMGISLGLLAPIPNALIAQLYEGDTRASMMGLTKTTGSFLASC
jgi:MFS family permease